MIAELGAFALTLALAFAIAQLGFSAAARARRSTVLDKYRKGEPTATQNPDANKGKISDVGQ